MATNHGKFFQSTDLLVRFLQYGKLRYIMNYGAKHAQNFKRDLKEVFYMQEATILGYPH